MKLFYKLGFPLLTAALCKATELSTDSTNVEVPKDDAEESLERSLGGYAVYGACCVEGDPKCYKTTKSECASWDGIFQGGDSQCFAQTCQRGACCFPNEAKCVVMKPGVCSSQGGIYKGVGTACNKSSCPEAYGACCSPSGDCQVLKKKNCDGEFQGSKTKCLPGTCKTEPPVTLPPATQPPVKTGGCCLPELGKCRDNFSETKCASKGGTYTGDGSTCNNGNCKLFGPCCLPGRCARLKKRRCLWKGGQFKGFGENCGLGVCRPLDEEPGACCISGTCFDDIEKEDCDGVGGDFLGPNTDCDDATCPSTLPPTSPPTVLPTSPPTGACCRLEAGKCSITDEKSCGLLHGSYLGDDTICNQSTCPILGACCGPNKTGKSCVETEKKWCNNGRVFKGFGTKCEPDTCSPLDEEPGACCISGTCFDDIEKEECGGVGGYFLGPNTDCDGATCPTPTPTLPPTSPPTGACCRLEAGKCSITDEKSCDLLHGNYLGDDTICNQSTCPILGACCGPNKTGKDCVQTEKKWCGDGRVFKGFGTKCEGDICSATAACCWRQDCQDLPQEACSVHAGSKWMAGKSCLPGGTCPLFKDIEGACCSSKFPDDNCRYVKPYLCALKGGAFRGVGTKCDTDGICAAPDDGACCLHDSCHEVSAEKCGNYYKGSFQGVGSLCKDLTCLHR